MGNSQSNQNQQQPSSAYSPTGSRRFGSPRPRTSSAATAASSPKRSSSLRSATKPTRAQSPSSFTPPSNTRPGSTRVRSPQPQPSSSSSSQYQQPTSPSPSNRVRSPIPIGSRLAPREREIRDAWEREIKEREAREVKEREKIAKEKEKFQPPYVHRSLQTKKKSLELPDLALTQVTTPTHSSASAAAQAIPIPERQPGAGYQYSTPIHIRSRSSSRPPDLPNPQSTAGPVAGHDFPRIVVRSSIPFPANLLIAEAKAAQATQAKLVLAESDSEEINNSNAVARSPSLLIPPISPPAHRVNPQPSEGEPTYLVKISWHGGGKEVFLTRAGDDDWNGRKKMENEVEEEEEAAEENSEKQTHESIIAGKGPTQVCHTGTTFSTIIALPRGTHHLRFLVDGQARVADDLPTAVDDNGSLANYVAVGLGNVGDAAAGDAVGDIASGDSPTTLVVAEGVDGAEVVAVAVDDVDVVVAQPEKTPRPGDDLISEFVVPDIHPHPTRVDSHSSFWSENEYTESHPPSLSSSPQTVISPLTSIDPNASATANNLQTPIRIRKVPYAPRWTREIPLELLEAAADEESYLSYENELENAHAAGRRIHITGFVPLPNIPPAPRLPRYLDKLILNNPVVPPIARNGSPNTSGTTSPGGAAGASVGAGNDIGNRSDNNPAGIAGIGAGLGERTSRDSRDSRTRDREGYPPLSPSREGRNGSRDGGRDGRDGSRDRRDGRNSRELREGRRREREWKSMSMVLAEGGEVDPTQRPNVNANAQESVEKSRGSERQRSNTLDRPLPITTASGTDVSHHPPASASQPPTSISMMPAIPEPWGPSSHISNSNANAIPSIADDASVLPVPSHVVLHHLCTSAMRNGVLAVGETISSSRRYTTSLLHRVHPLVGDKKAGISTI
ncbi:hypothetical protein EV368DRAFT_62352 [Lentinula lateritia]|uniref:Uncharacterized protein n=1 Tax=Lentinula aff. lateritia TaxID=2804960 RepID=A0ACC1TYT0_9AGAR|nr:hypothetical protein F5876DRAFT_66032 [Lentinula aff. lateritia]KAJ3855568.1 hypothetical protein EV368DRAFT_62352 [Lentinula lateritia]